MIKNSAVTTILPVFDINRAVDFYKYKLELLDEGEQANGQHLFSCGGTSHISLMSQPEQAKSEHTALSFEVNDITTSVDELEQKGVAFNDYDLPDLKTVHHVCVMGSEKAAWFNDSEGNILCLHEIFE